MSIVLGEDPVCGLIGRDVSQPDVAWQITGKGKDLIRLILVSFTPLSPPLSSSRAFSPSLSGSPLRERCRWKDGGVPLLPQWPQRKLDLMRLPLDQAEEQHAQENLYSVSGDLRVRSAGAKWQHMASGQWLLRLHSAKEIYKGLVSVARCPSERCRPVERIFLIGFVPKVPTEILHFFGDHCRKLSYHHLP